MKDPHEHNDMPHESEDVRKRDCRKYKELYGKHFYGRLFTEHHECAMYAYLYISDPDGYEGIAFQRWLADIKAQDDEVPWQRFI